MSEHQGSIFSDINFDEGSDNPFGLEKGTHEVVVSEAKIERSEKGNLGLWVTFSAEDGKSIRKWTTMPEPDQPDETRQRNVSFLRLFLRQLSIPESQWAQLNPEDLVGIEAVITVVPQKDSDYFSVKKISTDRSQASKPYTGSGPGVGEFKPPTEDSVPAGGGLGF